MHKSTRIMSVLVGLIASGMVLLAPAATAATSGTTATHHVVRHHHHARHHRKHHHHRRHHRRHHHHHAGPAGMEQHALHIALSKQGDPYVYGASGPNAFDCSGLTSYAFHRAGFHGLPRTASEQSRFAHRISRSNMRPGDLMFFYSGGSVYHVGIYDGFKNGHRVMVDAPHPGTSVRREGIWSNAWFPGTMR